MINGIFIELTIVSIDVNTKQNGGLFDKTTKNKKNCIRIKKDV